jgi:GAF domain
MKRRFRAGGEPVKMRRRKAMTLKRGNAPKTVRGRGPSNAKLQEQLDRRTRELHEALEQQAATDEVLQVISRSAFDLDAVLYTLVESAARLCDADKGVILRPSGDDASYYVAASYHQTPQYSEYLKKLKFAPGRSSVVPRVLLERKSVQIPDVLADPEYTSRELATLGDFRTVLGVPLLRDGFPMGVLVLPRAAVRPFTDKQIKLVETFADQAVIAIENTRLFEAEQQRSRELSESLEQQTATSEVLEVISSSPGELQPVFETILENAARICEATYGAMWLREGDGFRNTAFHGALPEAYTGQWRSGMVIPPGPDAPLARVARSRKPVHVADLRKDRAYLDGHALTVTAVDVAGIRTAVFVPMLKNNEPCLSGCLT